MPPCELTHRRRGASIAFVGVLCVSPDSMLVRCVRADGATQLQILFWKYIFVASLSLIFLLAYVGGHKVWHGFKLGPLHILGGMLGQLALSICLNLAFLNTVVARALLFFALNPLWYQAQDPRSTT